MASPSEDNFPIMDIKSLHHVAYRCKDAKQTAEFYTKVLGLEYAMAMAEDRVPSTGEQSPYMHIFFRMADGSYVAFFEIPESPPMGRDANTPLWVQHLALRVPDMKTLMAYKKKLEKLGIEVVGPTDHTICKSIYFFDPNGIRLEFSHQKQAEPRVVERWKQTREEALEELRTLSNDKTWLETMVAHLPERR